MTVSTENKNCKHPLLGFLGILKITGVKCSTGRIGIAIGLVGPVSISYFPKYSAKYQIILCCFYLSEYAH